MDTDDLKEIKTYYYDGSLEKIYYVNKDNELEGLFKSFFEDGKTMYENTFINGKRSGVCREWDYGAQIKKEFTYKNGVKHGLQRWFHPNGKIWIEEIYKDGKILERKNCNKNGATTETEIYKNGELELYDENGNLKTRFEFGKNGYSSKKLEFDVNGNLIKTTIYKDGIAQ